MAIRIGVPPPTLKVKKSIAYRMYMIVYNTYEVGMAELFKSITEVRKVLPELSQVVQKGADRYVITNQGKPQSVLMGYAEYQGLMAAEELLNRPKEMASLKRGLAQQTQLSFAEVQENLRRRKTGKPVAETAPALTSEEDAESLGSKLDEMHDMLQRVVRHLDEPASAKPRIVARPHGQRFAPLRDRLPVMRIPQGEVTRTGLILPDVAREKTSDEDRKESQDMIAATARALKKQLKTVTKADR